MTEYFVHERGMCETSDVGERTRIWAFTHILPGAAIGADCNICEHVFIENDVVVGDRTTVKNGVQLWDGVRVGSDVFIGPNATFTNDMFPRSRRYQQQSCATVVSDGASIGANATILPGVVIGANAMVGAGSVVTQSVPANAIVYGNPARIRSYANPIESKPHRVVEAAGVSPLFDGEEAVSLEVGSCSLWPLRSFEDIRGELVVAQFEDDLPFVPKRQFFVYGRGIKGARGERAHKNCAQFCVAISGSLSVIVNDGSRSCEVMLNTNKVGLLISPLVWGTQYKFSEDAVLAVYASHGYDSDDYIRSYSDFLEYISKT